MYIINDSFFPHGSEIERLVGLGGSKCRVATVAKVGRTRASFDGSFYTTPAFEIKAVFDRRCGANRYRITSGIAGLRCGRTIAAAIAVIVKRIVMRAPDGI